MKCQDFLYSWEAEGARSLAGFHYLGRRHDELDSELRWAVRGPRFFAPDSSKPQGP